MSGDGGQTVDGILPGDNFASNSSATVNVTFTTANAGDKKNYWTLWDEAKNGSTLCSGSFSGGGTSWTTTVDFGQCSNYTGLAFMEYGIEDNTTGDKFKIRFLPITIGNTSEYLKTFSDSGYSTETTSFNAGDTVYIEVNSAAIDSALGGSCDGTQAVKLAGFDDTKYIDKANMTTCQYVGGTTYRFAFDLTENQGTNFPTGTYWYQSELKPQGSNQAQFGITIQITK